MQGKKIISFFSFSDFTLIEGYICWIILNERHFSTVCLAHVYQGCTLYDVMIIYIYIFTHIQVNRSPDTEASA